MRQSIFIMKEIIWKLTAIFLCLIPASAAYSVTTTKATKQIGNSVTLRPKTNYTMYVKVTDENREGFQITGDYNMATRQTVTIKAIKRGTWQFGVTHGDGTAYVNVWKVVDVVDIRIPSAITLKPGETYKFNPVITDSEAETTLTWNSSNSSVASIDQNGSLKAIKPGSTDITVIASNGIRANCKVSIQAINVQSINIDAVPELSVGDTYKIKYNILPTNASNKNVTFHSSNANIIDVSQSGDIIALSEGTAFVNIKATDGSNITSSVKVTVKETPKDECRITFNISNYGLFTLDTKPGNVISVDYSPYSNIWRVTTFSFNGTEIMPSEGKYTTPIIENDATINIDLEIVLDIIGEISNTNNVVFKDDINVELIGEKLNIKGLKNGDNVDIYLINGMKIYSERINMDGSMSISLPKNTYIISINETINIKVLII